MNEFSVQILSKCYDIRDDIIKNILAFTVPRNQSYHALWSILLNFFYKSLECFEVQVMFGSLKRRRDYVWEFEEETRRRFLKMNF